MAAQAVEVAPFSMAKAETSITNRWDRTMGGRTCGRLEINGCVSLCAW
jgi:hypothetical protein